MTDPPHAHTRVSFCTLPRAIWSSSHRIRTGVSHLMSSFVLVRVASVERGEPELFFFACSVTVLQLRNAAQIHGAS